MRKIDSTGSINTEYVRGLDVESAGVDDDGQSRIYDQKYNYKRRTSACCDKAFCRHMFFSTFLVCMGVLCLSIGMCGVIDECKDVVFLSAARER